MKNIDCAFQISKAGRKFIRLDPDDHDVAGETRAFMSTDSFALNAWIRIHAGSSDLSVQAFIRSIAGIRQIYIAEQQDHTEERYSDHEKNAHPVSILSAIQEDPINGGDGKCQR